MTALIISLFVVLTFAIVTKFENLKQENQIKILRLERSRLQKFLFLYEEEFLLMKKKKRHYLIDKKTEGLLNLATDSSANPNEATAAAMVVCRDIKKKLQ